MSRYDQNDISSEIDPFSWCLLLHFIFCGRGTEVKHGLQYKEWSSSCSTVDKGVFTTLSNI